MISNIILILTLWGWCASSTHGLQLKFDPNYSPPSVQDALDKPWLYRAYNRPALSHIRRHIKVRIEDDNGDLITSGPDSELYVDLIAETGFLRFIDLPDESSISDQLTANDEQMLFFIGGSEHPLQDNHITIRQDPYQVKAYKGIAEFPYFFATTPTVYIQNTTTAYPYVPNTPVLLNGACCKNVWRATPTDLSKASAAISNPYHIFHRAEFLELITKMPQSILTGQALPPLEVRIMTLDYQYRNPDGSPIPLPLLHGPDTDIDIVLTVSWEQKIFAKDRPVNVSVDGMNSARLLHSNVYLLGDDVVSIYSDDLAIRKHASLLPGGYYGAVFEGIHFNGVVSNLRLNFTMTYPGGKAYFDDLTVHNTLDPQPYSRVSLGFGELPRIDNYTLFKIRPPAQQSQFVKEEETRPVDGLWPYVYMGYEKDAVVLMKDADSTDIVNHLSCGLISDPQRREWCEESGFTTQYGAEAAQGVLLSPPFNVVARNATSLRISWEKPEGDLPEVVAMPFWHTLSIQVLDDEGFVVTDGPDAELSIIVEGLLLNSNNITDVMGLATMCDPAQSGNLKLTHGSAVYRHAVCRSAQYVALKFTLTSTNGIMDIAHTIPFSVQANIPLGIMLPYEDSSSPFTIDNRALQMFIQQPVDGYQGLGPSSRLFGHTDSNYEMHFIDTRGAELEVLAKLDSAKQQYRIRQFVGPFKDDNAEAIAQWLSHSASYGCHGSFFSGSQPLGDRQRFPNLWRVGYSSEMYFKALVTSMKNKKWNQIVLLHNTGYSTFDANFYSNLRSENINVGADIKIPPTATSLAPFLKQIRDTGLRIILTNLQGDIATRVFREAITSKVDAVHGFQWIGTDDTLESIDLLAITDAHIHFAGAQFLSPMYGLGQGARSFQAISYADFQMDASLGGMDPFWVKDIDFDINKLNIWTFSKTTLALDVVWFMSFSVVATLDYRISMSQSYCSNLWKWVYNLPLHSGSALNFEENLDRIGFQGVWSQIEDQNLPLLKQQQEANGLQFNPWSITTTIDLPTNSADVIESRFIDPRTLQRSNWPTYGPNITLTRRSFVARDAVGLDVPVYNTTDLVPVTHICVDGCGGELQDANVSAYAYQNGECVDPNTCECIRTHDNSRFAFTGEHCDLPNCLHSCRNGECTFRNGDATCMCEDGWEGDACERAICSSCSEHGSCDLPETCVCEDGWYGSACSRQCLCRNNATCSDGNTGTGECSCPPLYWGEYCQFQCNCVHGICSDGSSGTGLCESCDSGYMGPTCAIPLAAVAAPAALGSILLIAVLFMALKFYIRLMRHRAMLANMDWKVTWSDVKLHTDDIDVSQKLESTMFLSSASQRGGTWRSEESLGKYKGQLVAITRLKKGTIDLNSIIKREIRAVRSTHNQNLLAFVGACLEKPNVAILHEFAQKGSLDDMVCNTDIKLDWNFRFHLLKEISSGMKYIHGSTLRAHGRLRSACCFIDNRWTVKIGDYGLRVLQGNQVNEDGSRNHGGWSSLRWTAPELLPGIECIEDMMEGTPSGDVYSFGIIMSEILAREQPYDDLPVDTKDIITTVSSANCIVSTAKNHAQIAPALVKVRLAWNGGDGNTEEGVLRPTIPSDCEPEYRKLMTSCWHQDPTQRPMFKDILHQLDTIHPTKGSMIDNLVKMLEKYSQDLEGIVSERTKELALEKEKVEELVCRMLPKTIVEDLKVGKNIKAESFDEVTIFFSDIVGFTRICSQSTPFQVVDMLNDLYTVFDTIIEDYDVYKVETIGDAYMVVSGLPVRNGDKHAGEIASMALHMLSAITSHRIRHLPNERLQLRIGLHSGPVVAGVVGTKMPRYCLFGDTVNIASRMESGGFALRIHMSDTTAAILHRLGGYHVQVRGERDVKGKGRMVTHWLNGKDGFNLPLPTDDMRASASQHEFK
eukprot:m.99782 g.99782  ORF g.99782 m.99782 type:complete len:1901 (+) comp9033_c2_seq1:508-6210(+)